MKKIFAFISVFLMLSVSIFADVSVKKLDNGKYEVTFFYGNPRAAEVVIAGDWTNWQNGAEPMTKTDKGWTYTKEVPAGTIMKYKFISDGNWTADIKAPDTVDDGFGGLNGLVDVNVLGAGGDGAAASGPKIKFQTWSMLGAQVKFDVKEVTKKGFTKDDAGLDSAGINLKSYWKFGGEVLPNVPVYVEVALAEQDSFNNLYQEGAYVKVRDEMGNVIGTKKADPTLAWKDGFLDLLNLGFDPIYYFGGSTEAATYLGHFKTGFNSDYVNWTTGYKYAKLPPHNINDWITVDKEWEAGYSSVGGFNYFELGSKLQQLPFGNIKAAIAPNKSADRAGNQYGFFGWVNASFGPMATIDFQYNGAYGKEMKSLFTRTYEHDFILGYKGMFGPVTLKANALYNIFGEGDLVVKLNKKTNQNQIYKNKYVPAASDVGAVDSELNGISNMAANVQAIFSNDTLSATVGYRMRGVQANMMYVEEGADDHTNISDQLGKLNSQRAWIDVNANVTTALNIGINPYIELALDSDKKTPYTKDGMKIYAKPYFALDLDEAFYVPGKLDGYAEFNYFTKEADKVSSVIGNNQFRIEAAGIKYSMELSGVVKGIEAIYCYDDTDGNKLFNSVVSTIKFDKDYNVQAGFGIRTKNSDAKADTEVQNPFGFFVGAYKKLPVLAKPTAYLQFMYAMDPYNAFGDGPTAYKLDDYKLDNGVSNYENSAAVRIGLQWDL